MSIYYPNSVNIYKRTSIPDLIEEMIDTPIGSIILFNSGSVITASAVTSDYALTSSYTINNDGGVNLTSGSIIPITASWVYNSIIGGSGKSLTKSWGVDKFISPSGSWTTGSAISMSVVERVPYHIWTGSYQQPFIITDPVRIPRESTHLRITFCTRICSGGTANDSSRFCVDMRMMHQSQSSYWSNETTKSIWQISDPYYYMVDGRTNTFTLEFPLSDLKISPETLTQFWFARDTGSFRNLKVPQNWGIYSINIEPFTARPIPSGSLKEALISKSLQVVSGRSYSTYTNRFLSRDSASATYVLSGSRLDDAAGFDASGFSVWNTTRGSNSPGFLVSPEHIITVNHYDYTPGAKIHFVDNTGTTHTRSIASRVELPNTINLGGGPYPDTSLHRLNSPLPPSIAWYKITDPYLEKYIVNHGQGIPAWIYYGIGDNFACCEIERYYKNNYTSSGYVAMSYPVENSSSLSSWYQQLIVGQSGSPLFFIMPDGEVVVFGGAVWGTPNAHEFGFSRVSSKDIYDKLNAAMIALGTSSSYTQVITRSFSEYPILTDYGYET